MGNNVNPGQSDRDSKRAKRLEEAKAKKASKPKFKFNAKEKEKKTGIAGMLLEDDSEDNQDYNSLTQLKS